MKNLTLIGIIVLMISTTCHATGQYDKFKALYIYNFTKRIDWPDSYKKGDFVMGILGKSEITNHLKDFTKNKKVLDQSIKVINYKNYQDIDTCHLLLVTAEYPGKLVNVIDHLVQSPTLVISEQPNAPACINFKETDKSLLFQINPKKIRDKKLKVSQSLINLGIEIQSDA